MKFISFTFLILFISGFNSLQSQEWHQLGKDINGENERDFFGTELSINSDGTILAIGTPYHDSKGKNTGYVKVYKYLDKKWEQLGQNILGDSKGDQFGSSLSISSDGSVLAIGSFLSDNNGKNSGKVKIFKFNGSKWIQLGNDILGFSSNDYFGASLSLSSDGSTIAIGATKSFFVKRYGQVSIFSYNGKIWQQIGEDIKADNRTEFFGGEVSINSDGSIVAIGAYYNDENGKQSGHVRIYENKNGSWKKMGQNLTGYGAKDFFGLSISLSSDGFIVAIGASGEAGFLHLGYICIYKYSNGVWQQIGEDIKGENLGGSFGTSVSLSSDGSVVAGGTNFNYVKVYENNEKKWLQVGAKISRRISDNLFGSPISLNSDGTIFAVGVQDSFGKVDKSGQVRVFKLIKK